MQQVTETWNRTTLTSKISSGSCLAAVALFFIGPTLLGFAGLAGQIGGEGNVVSSILGGLGCLACLGAMIFLLPSLVVWGFRNGNKKSSDKQLVPQGKKNSGKQLFPLSTQNAFATIVLSVIVVDGHISNLEIHTAALSLAKKHLFSNNSLNDLDLEKISLALQREGFEYMATEARNALPYELRETAFAMATDLAIADGYLDENEEYYLGLLYQILEIPEYQAAKIIEVIGIKNRS